MNHNCSATLGAHACKACPGRSTQTFADTSPNSNHVTNSEAALEETGERNVPNAQALHLKVLGPQLLEDLNQGLLLAHLDLFFLLLENRHIGTSIKPLQLAQEQLHI